MSGYKIYTVSTANWSDKALVDPSSCSWSRTYNESSGANTSTFKLSDPDVRATSTGGLLTPMERALVVEYDSVVVYAGIIWEDDYDRDTQTLTITHEDIWSVIELRLISPDRTGNITAWKQTYSGLEYDTIVKRLMQLATAGAGRTIPIVYENDYPGSHARTYYGYNLDTAIDAITEIMDLPNGPDIDFRPEWNAARDGLQWTLRTGDLNPDGQIIEVVANAMHSAVKGIKYKRSGRERATRFMGVGEGSGIDMKVSAASTNPSFALERVEQAKNIKSTAALQSFADGRLASRQDLIAQYSMDLNTSEPQLSNLWKLKPGSTLRWYMDNDPKIPDGWKNHRVIAYSGTISSNWITLELQ